MKNAGDQLQFSVKLVDENNKNFEFEDGEKKYTVKNFLTEFLA